MPNEPLIPRPNRIDPQSPPERPDVAPLREQPGTASPEYTQPAPDNDTPDCAPPECPPAG